MLALFVVQAVPVAATPFVQEQIFVAEVADTPAKNNNNVQVFIFL